MSSSLAFAFIRTVVGSNQMVFSYVFILGGLGSDNDKSSLKRFSIGLEIFLSLICLYRQSCFTVKMSEILSVSRFFRRGMVWAFTPERLRARIVLFVAL